MRSTCFGMTLGCQALTLNPQRVNPHTSPSFVECECRKERSVQQVQARHHDVDLSQDAAVVVT